MDLRPHFNKERLSHAYVVEGDHSETLPAIRELIVHFGISARGNPDYHEVEHDVFTVDDARELIRTQGLHGGEGKKKIFIIAIRTISHESQNALLKTIEEPTAHTHFFFLVRSSAMLLPTIRSRVQLVSAESAKRVHEHTLAEKFVPASIPDRMQLIASMTKAKADDKSEAKEEARNFLRALERMVGGQLRGGSVAVARALEDIIYAERELSGRAPSLKLLLEHLALTVPRP